MSLQDISLPIDIPWKLIATSEDMLANHKKRFPHAMWKSSLAVFAYDPDPDTDLPEEISKDRKLTFLKVVCSITSYVPPCEDCPPPPEPVQGIEDFGANDAANMAEWEKQCKAINDIQHKIYACSGALVQVAIYPKDEKNETSDPSKLAYFASFEPKKRELIEVVTESGETMTQSKSNLNVRKGTTATDSTEDHDMLTGVNIGGGFAGASAQVGVTGQWGTIKKSGSEHVDVTNSDSSREMREGTSHTTSLSQLYHLLNSYHLGTNRAIFFVQPRPHTAQQKDKFTFIGGPQEIEGIQEFFLVVSRPKEFELSDYCIDALLYTAHLDDESIAKELNQTKTAETQWIDFSTLCQKLPDGGHSIWDIAEDFKDVLNYVEDQVQNVTNIWSDTPDPTPTDAKQTQPKKCDGYITPSFIYNPDKQSLISKVELDAERDQEYLLPSGNGSWKIDRTRGLGGYDLWEDPNNQTALPAKPEISKFPPEALVDIISINSPEDHDHYLSDYGLRVRAMTWPSNEGFMFYHGRIKAYFIKADSHSNPSNINLFITVRGTSTCTDSPLFNYAPDKAVLIASDIVAENQIKIINVSPWKVSAPHEKAANFKSLIDPDDKDKQIIISDHAGNSPPSGLDPQIIGASHAKMANMIGKQVINAMNSSLSCLAEKTDGLLLHSFIQSDLFWNKMSGKLLNDELKKLTTLSEKNADLSNHVIGHYKLPEIHSHVPVVSILRQRIKKDLETQNIRSEKIGQQNIQEMKSVPLKEAKKKTISAKQQLKKSFKVTPDKEFSVLTLANKQVTKSNRELLGKAGVRSVLDLIGVSAKDLAERLKTDERTIRKIRLRILGLDLNKKDHGS